MLRYLTAGESHGRALIALVDGFPAGVQLNVDAINGELVRRQGGYGRGGRQKIETDHVEILSGIWRGTTLGSPIALMIPNADFKINQMEDLIRPRPGHGDLSGSIKYLTSVRAILERASARETTTRVAAGALAKQMLAPLGITAFAYVVQLGSLRIDPKPGTLAEQIATRDSSIMYTLDASQDQAISEMIDECRKAGDTLGGIVEIRVEGVPYGLGTHTQWDKKLDGRLAQAVMAVQAMKGVEIGMGFDAARVPGSMVHDPIQYDASQANSRTLGFTRTHNNAGGLEAGMSNSQPIVLRVAKKPISTLAKPLESVNLETKKSESAAYERSDVCALAAASCILENVVAFEIACAVVDKFGGDNLEEIKERIDLFYAMARKKLQ